MDKIDNKDSKDSKRNVKKDDTPLDDLLDSLESDWSLNNHLHTPNTSNAPETRETPEKMVTRKQDKQDRDKKNKIFTCSFCCTSSTTNYFMNHVMPSFVHFLSLVQIQK